MSGDPEFLTRAQIDILHERSLAAFGGSPGLRDENLLESALAAAINVWLYENGESFEIAASYAFHIAEAQAFLDGNKRTAIGAALTFLALNGNSHEPPPEELIQLYDAMIAIANREMTKADLAGLFRKLF